MVPVAAMCRGTGTHTALSYRWMKDAMEATKARLKGDEQRGATRSEV